MNVGPIAKVPCPHCGDLIALGRGMALHTPSCRAAQREISELLAARPTPDECVVWTGVRSPQGYGRLPGPGGRQQYAHRVVAARTIGRDLLPGEVVLHRCDNPPCVNPAHLRVGTHLNVGNCDCPGFQIAAA